MGVVFNLLLFLILIHTPFAITVAKEDPEYEIQNVANSLHIPPPPPSPPPSETAAPVMRSFKSGIAIIVAVLAIIFSIILLLLLYAKHCTGIGIVYVQNPNNIPLARESSGINRKVIETLPMFRFSSLRGQKDGLECAVCLTRFEPQEVLRLLPKCKHAFHVECVDTWLDEHSTCPLCRCRVDPDDIVHTDPTKGKEIVGTRIVSQRHSSSGGNSLEIIVENSGRDLKKGRASFDSWKSRRRRSGSADIRSKSTNSWSAFRRKSGTSTENAGGRKDWLLPVQEDKHRLDHRIIISVGGEAELEGEEKRRWSDVQAADNLYLKSEMILGGGVEGSGRGRGVSNDRSVSEITGMSRYRRTNKGGREIEAEEEEGGTVAKRWLDWIPKSQQLHKTTAASSSSTAV